MALDSDPISAGFESYVSVDDADVIIASRGGNSEWDGLTITNKEVQLRLATEYIDRTYLFIGCLSSLTQPLAWPRMGTIYDLDEIPDIVKRATAILGRDSISTQLHVNVSASSTTGAQVKSTKKKLDVMESSVSYFEGASGKTQNTFTETASILKPVTTVASAERG